MGLTLVTGRANSGRTGVVYDIVRKAADAGRRPSLLLPTYPDVARATEELARTHPLGIHVEQLDRWIEELWSLWGDGRRPIAAEQRRLLVADAIGDSRMRALSRTSSTPGFVRLMSYVVQRAAEIPREVVDGSTVDSAADAEMLGLIRAYRRAADAAGLVEPGEASLLLSADPPSIDGPVVLHRFADLGRSQESLLIGLSAACETWLTLPWEEGFPATEAVGQLVARLSSLATRLHCPAPDDQGELARLEANLFGAPKPSPSQGAVRFCTAAGEEAEAALIAELARDAARRHGADRVAIVFRDARRHVARLRIALEGVGVPADFDVLVPAGTTPYGMALKRLIAAVSGGDGGDVLSFLRGPFSGIDAASVDGLDARWRSGGVADIRRIRTDAARSGPGPGRALKLADRVAGQPLSARSLSNWKELADALLAAAHDAGSLLTDPDALLDAAAHRALLQVVARLTEVGHGRLAASDVLMALDEMDASPAQAERPGHVQVTEAHRLRSRRFDVVIVGGLTAGDFSAEGRSSVAASIADRLLGAERPTEQAVERLLFYDVCTRARRELVLTRQTADSEGSEKRPSVFWQEALDLYRAPEADAAPGMEDAILADTVRLSDLHRGAPALTPGRAFLRAQAAAGDLTGCDPRVAEASARTSVRKGRLHDTEMLGLLAARHEFSATELELYARCPYRWFYERAVRPATLDVTLDARTHGSLAHRALADFYAALPARLGSPRVTAANTAAAVELAGEVFDRAAAAPDTPPVVTLTDQDDLATTRRRVLDLVAADAEFLTGLAPERVELRFGTADPAHPDPSSAGAVDLDGFLLRGSIDRVDAGGAGLAVIDYKSGSVPKGADLLPDRHLQVGLYAAVAARLMGRPVVAGLYRSLKTGAARGFWSRSDVAPDGLTSTDALADPSELEAVIEASVQLARDAADGIRAGEIPARPASPKACEYCPAAGFCGGGC